MSAHKCQSIFPQQPQTISTIAESNNVKIESKYSGETKIYSSLKWNLFCCADDIGMRLISILPHMQTSMRWNIMCKNLDRTKAFSAIPNGINHEITQSIAGDITKTQLKW